MNESDIRTLLCIAQRNTENPAVSAIIRDAIRNIDCLTLEKLPPMNDEELAEENPAKRVHRYRERVQCSFIEAMRVVVSYDPNDPLQE